MLEFASSGATASNMSEFDNGRGRQYGKKKTKQKRESLAQELVGEAEDKRNWRGILIALLVIITVLGLIVTAIVLITPKVEEKQEGVKMKFTDYIQGHYEPRVFQPVWRNGTIFVYRNSDGSVVQYDCSDNSTVIVMDNSTFRELDTGQYKISADGKYALLPYDLHYQYRHSNIARYKLYNTETKVHVDLVGPVIDGHPREDSFQYITWSPTGHSLAAVQYNNLYLLRDIEKGNYQQLTYDGELDDIFNGVPDWLYEEEILHSDGALWWCPDGSCILYANFDDRNVHRYDMSMYGPLKEKYIETRRLPYPKPGTPNPEVTLKIFHFENNATSIINPPKDFRKVDHYLTSITWKNETHVIITWLNRPQNVSIISICSMKSSLCIDNYRADADGGWVDITAGYIFRSSDINFFAILPQKDGEYGNFKHIAKLDGSADITNTFSEGKIFITTGRMTVTKIVGFDSKTQIIYFLAIQQHDPREKHLYSAVTSKDEADFRIPKCLSCDINKDCLFVEALFSPTGQFYILNCKGPGVPYFQLMKTPNTFVTLLEDNLALRNKMAGKYIPRIEFVKIPIENKEFLWGKLLLPPVLKEDEIITYNLLVKVYGAPNTQHVTHEFEIGWEHYQSSVNGLIIGYVDGRGSGGRGDRWLHATYKHLGGLEVQDSIMAARHFKSRPYVNERAAIWGISHGGYVTSAVLGSSKNVYSCGVAVSPVTDWRYYDSFYSERYMGLPSENDNLEGYNQANVSRNALNFKKSKFMLVHGTGDDNVHFQNTAQFMKALTEKDIYFRTQIYTDQQHWLNGGNTRNHLYNTMEDFLFSCFGKPSPREEDNNDVVDKDAEEVEE